MKFFTNHGIYDTENTYPVRAALLHKFSIEEVAQILANTYRYAGQGAMNVALHSVLVAERAFYNFWKVNIRETTPEEKKIILYHLLHDVGEFIIGDIVRPIKELVPMIDSLEDEILATYVETHKIPLEINKFRMVTQADLFVARIEQHVLFGQSIDLRWFDGLQVKKETEAFFEIAKKAIKARSFADSATLFCKYYNDCKIPYSS